MNMAVNVTASESFETFSQKVERDFSVICQFVEQNSSPVTQAASGEFVCVLSDNNEQGYGFSAVVVAKQNGDVHLGVRSKFQGRGRLQTEWIAHSRSNEIYSEGQSVRFLSNQLQNLIKELNI